MEIGVIVILENGGRCFDAAADLGLKVCQLDSWDVTLATPQIAETVNRESARTGVRICAFWAGWPGKHEWNFTQGPVTLGLVPLETRRMRIDALKKMADFATWIGVPAIITHCGFIPENMTDPAYPGVVDAITEVAEYCQRLGLGFWFETGQETPVVLLRTIERIGAPNLGINLDPANLILYGKANPVDALDVIGKYVRNVHVKDGFYPTNGNELGREVPPGEGRVDFPSLLGKLKGLGYEGELIIEREISGEQQIIDIRKTITNLQTWLAEI